MKLRNCYLFTLILVVFNQIIQAQNKVQFQTKPSWSDEFNVSGLPDAKKWGYDVGGDGWGNNEKQYYTKDRLENARVENGKLIIEVRKEDYQGSAYTSARLVTKNKADFLYGKIEMKAKLPSGRGTWPALWMLASQQSYGEAFWPHNGEIDIMEHVGYDQGTVVSTVHTKAFNHTIGTQKSGKVFSEKVSTEFQIYTLEWSPQKMEMFMNGKSIFTFDNSNQSWEQWPFDKKFHLLFNIAVGGNWGGQKGIDETIFPQRMEVDYVRYYALKK